MPRAATSSRGVPSGSLPSPGTGKSAECSCCGIHARHDSRAPVRFEHLEGGRTCPIQSLTWFRRSAPFSAERRSQALPLHSQVLAGGDRVVILTTPLPALVEV